MTKDLWLQEADQSKSRQQRTWKPILFCTFSCQTCFFSVGWTRIKESLVLVFEALKCADSNNKRWCRGCEPPGITGMEPRFWRALPRQIWLCFYENRNKRLGDQRLWRRFDWPIRKGHSVRGQETVLSLKKFGSQLISLPSFWKGGGNFFPSCPPLPIPLHQDNDNRIKASHSWKRIGMSDLSNLVCRSQKAFVSLSIYLQSALSLRIHDWLSHKK